MIDLVIAGKVHLTEISVSNSGMNHDGHYRGATGSFCKLEWRHHKSDPSTYPMFRDLVKKSDCSNDGFELDLKMIVDKARNYDDAQYDTPDDEKNVHHMDPTGFVFHESRCGSTLVANSLAAMDPAANRVYSESAPPVSAVRVCGPDGSHCPPGRAAELLRDVIYLMGRTNDPNEQHLFFKIQSIGTKAIHVFLEAFPDVPWIFVYREPVQIMMSQLAHGVESANCVHQLRDVPQKTIDAMEEEGKDLDSLTPVEKCALHLSLLCESALHGLFDSGMMGRPVNYENIVQKLIDHIIPDHFKVLLTNEGKENILEVGSKYSKGRGERQKEWKEDSEQKEKEATPEVRAAASFFLQEWYEQLEDESGNEYYNGGGVAEVND